MNFRNYLLNEEDPIGGPPGGGLGGPPSLGGPPGGGLGGPPSLGGPPGMGGPPPSLGGLGGPPSLGGPPGMGGPPGGTPQSEPPVIPKNANVWDVLHHLLYHIPFKDDKKQEKDNSGQDKKIPPKNDAPEPSLLS